MVQRSPFLYNTWLAFHDAEKQHCSNCNLPHISIQPCVDGGSHDKILTGMQEDLRKNNCLRLALYGMQHAAQSALREENDGSDSTQTDGSDNIQTDQPYKVRSNACVAHIPIHTNKYAVLDNDLYD